MGAAKIQDEQEVLKWFEQGKSYPWMVKKYMDKYNIEIGVTAFANFRRRHGLDRRMNRNDVLLPWAIKPEHRYDYSANMLRLEARLRAGLDVSPGLMSRLEGWKKGLERDHVVVDYDPDKGWLRVKRRKSDADLIRKPRRATTLQPNRDEHV